MNTNYNVLNSYEFYKDLKKQILVKNRVDESFNNEIQKIEEIKENKKIINNNNMNMNVNMNMNMNVNVNVNVNVNDNNNNNNMNNVNINDNINNNEQKDMEVIENINEMDN